MHRKRCAFLLKIAVICALFAVRGAAISGSAAPRFSFHHYGAESGLANATVLALYQDKTGFLWVGTESGLYRYEGSFFRQIDANDGFPCLAEVGGIVESDDGALWVLGCNHLYRSWRGHFELVPYGDIIKDSLQGMTAEGVGALVASHDGILQATGKRDTNGHLELRVYPLPASVRNKSMRGLYRNGETLWFGCDQKLWSFRSGVLTDYGTAFGLPVGDWDGIQIKPNGEMWVRSPKLTYWKERGGAAFHVFPGLAPSFSNAFTAITKDGSVLIPTSEGLAVIGPHGTQIIDQARGLRTSLTSVAIEDRQGSIWVGLLGEGLARWQGRGEWQAWTKENGLPSNIIWSITRAQKDQSLWVGTSQGVARFAPNGSVRVWNWAQQVNGTVRWIREAPDGGIWLVAQGDTLARIDPISGKVKFFGKSEGMTAHHLVRGNFDAEGRLWLATRSGLFVSKSVTAEAHFEAVPGSPTGVWDAAQDKTGAIFATSARGLWRYSNEGWQHFDKNSGLLSNSPYVIAIAPDGALWLRHRYDGAVERVEFSGDRLASDLEVKPDNTPAQMTALHGFDSHGGYWQGTADGLAMLEDPASYVSGSKTAHTWRFFTQEDGLVANDTDGEAFWADSDGSVWIGTSGGLAHYSAATDKTPQSAVDASEGSPIITAEQVSQRPRSAQIQFSSLDFINEGLTQFAYSIDGGNWVDAKERSVTLASLHPGNHQFRVRMRPWGNGWNAKTASVVFTFEPFWWETWWASLLACIVMGGGVFGVAKLWIGSQRRRADERAQILEEKARAEAASQAKSLFLAHMSHEIRTPLHQIIGLTEDLAALTLPADVREITTHLQSSGRGLYNLLNGILDFSKIEAGKLEIESAAFQLRPALSESLSLFSRTANEKRIGLVLDYDAALPDFVMGDSTRLRQVLVCLLSNAVKFTHEGQIKVSAQVKTAQESRTTVQFSVADSGIGISAEKLSRLFRPFTQGDASTTRKYGGTGLGLTIAKSLVALMGGELAVTSAAGQGTCFTFSLVFEHASGEPKAEELARPLNKLRILVAEDNKINQKILLNLLARIGHHADVASDGAQAIDAAIRQTYDLILMDIQMPNVDGIEATRQIRHSLTGKPQPRILALTAHATMDDRKECIEAGMDGYLTKPISQDVLSRSLADI